jgi:hypothetical protein
MQKRIIVNFGEHQPFVRRALWHCNGAIIGEGQASMKINQSGLIFCSILEVSNIGSVAIAEPQSST